MEEEFNLQQQQQPLVSCSVEEGKMKKGNDAIERGGTGSGTHEGGGGRAHEEEETGNKKRGEDTEMSSTGFSVPDTVATMPTGETEQVPLSLLLFFRSFLDAFLPLSLPPVLPPSLPPSLPPALPSKLPPLLLFPIPIHSCPPSLPPSRKAPPPRGLGSRGNEDGPQAQEEDRHKGESRTKGGRGEGEGKGMRGEDRRRGREDKETTRRVPAEVAPATPRRSGGGSA